METKFHLKGLNGLRGIGAISVIMAHTAIPGYWVNRYLPIGLANYFVTIFFTLSGFLITYLLFCEKQKKEISIKNFYYRRLLRIWPLYFVYLLAAVLVIYLQTPEKLPGSLAWYILFAANVPRLLHNHLPYLAHYWTLGVEEQFYIFWPWLIKKSKNVLTGIIIFTVAFFMLKLFVRLFYYDAENDMPLAILYVNRFECMSIGGIAALLCLKKNTLFFTITTNKYLEIICWLSLVVMAANRFFISHFINHDIVALITVCLIVNLSFNDKAMVSLEHRYLDILGKISYGLYVIHPLVVMGMHKLIDPLNWGIMYKYALLFTGVIAISIYIAWLSYEYFEKRFLRLKSRFSVVRSSD